MGGAMRDLLTIVFLLIAIALVFLALGLSSY
jgi:hypothetical protein